MMRRSTECTLAVKSCDVFLVVEQQSPVFGRHQLRASHVNSSVGRDDAEPLVMFWTSLKDGHTMNLAACGDSVPIPKSPKIK